ncbi:MAG: hypothetical protein ACYC6M_02815 [Terriglobales bacterium]
MTRMFRSAAALTVLLFAVVALFGQTRIGSTIHLKQKKFKETQSYTGLVQTFSHSAITLRDLKNPLALRTFPYTIELREALRERHLEYGDKVKVIYNTTDGGHALKLHGRLRRGS